MMKMKGAFKAALTLSIIGLLFSGYLTYHTFTTGQAGCDVFYFGFPSCFYGMLVYLAIFVCSLVGIRGNKPMSNKKMLAISVISIIGALFALYITMYVLANTTCTSLDILGIPPCVYGLVMYGVVFILAVAGLRAKE